MSDRAFARFFSRHFACLSDQLEDLSRIQEAKVSIQ
jgi:hypothetical protein